MNPPSGERGHPGSLPDPATLVDVPKLVTAYYTLRPDPAVPEQRVSFGTSGHRGSAFDCAFNEAHIVAITHAICRYRQTAGIDGPLFLGIDTHALSTPAAATTLEVLAAHGVDVMIDHADGFTPTPVVSHAILQWNRGRTSGLADGIIVTPSHNPPADGGFKYNPPHGGPADGAITAAIQREANGALGDALTTVRRVSLSRARNANTTHLHDYIASYVPDLASVIDFDAIRAGGPSLGVDPLGGSGVRYWERIADLHRCAIDVVSTEVDPTFRFMTLDWDGRIRMDPSSPDAMGRLIELRERYDVAWACDTDHDRHGIVARSCGLMRPNDYLAAATAYLFEHRAWPSAAGVGKTVVTSTMVDRIAERHGRTVHEVPVGFKWFVGGLTDGSLGFVCEESAGATLLRRDGNVWTTDKDGIVMGLLAAEMTAVTGLDPGELDARIRGELGDFAYARIDAPATAEQKAVLSALQAGDVTGTALAGDPISGIQTNAPGNGAPIGGLKVTTERGWFAARPSGTENVYKLYAESFAGPEHLALLQAEAKEIIARALDPAS